MDALTDVRRSSRDRSHQKTPYQQREELSSTITGEKSSVTEKVSKGILSDGEVNPMAPIPEKKSRSTTAVRKIVRLSLLRSIILRFTI